MTGPLEKLNLRPFEKRLVVGVAVVIFIVVNVVFVFPYFSKWGDVQQRRANALEKLAKWQKIAGEEGKYTRLVKELQNQGSSVAPEEQTYQFTDTILKQASSSGVNIMNKGRISSTTNAFFLEQSQTIVLQSGEQQLVDFLYNLGAGNSLIRVRDLNLQPDQARQNLSASVKLIASFQKKSPGKGAPAVRKTASASSSLPLQP
jgi:hypothetical protein